MWQTSRISFLASLVLVWTLATVAVVLRLIARRMTKMRLSFDDYCCLAAYVSCLLFFKFAIVLLGIF